MAHVSNLDPSRRPPTPSLDRGPVQRRARPAHPQDLWLRGRHRPDRAENSIFTKLGAIGTLSADFFHVGAGAADLNDFIIYIYDDATGALYYDSNGSAAGQQVQFADPGLSLSHADLFVI
jgi:hypothetical protein